MANEIKSAVGQQDSWLKYTDAIYDACAGKWRYVADHLDGTLIDSAKIETYLHRRKQGESDDAYAERKNIVDFTPHFARAVLTLAGMAWSADPQKEVRRWGDGEKQLGGLGDPDADGTIMSRLSENADGRGTNWTTILKGATVDVIGYQKIWGLVEGVTRDGEGNVIGGSSVRIIPPQAVPRAIYQGGRLISVKVETTTDLVLDQKEKPKEEKRWLIFDVEGVETWRENEKGEPEMVGPKRFYGGEGNPGFRFLDRDGNPVLPIFPVELPLRSQLGYLMAKKENAIFNQENTLDFLLWVACFPKFFGQVQNPVTGAFDEKLFSELKKALKDGQNFLPGNEHKFDAPPIGPAEIKKEVLEQKVETYYTTFFQQYGDAAREKTATEIRQDFRAGIEAFLTLLVTTLDELENGLLWRLEQIESNGPAWGGGEPGQAYVQRSRDFQEVDLEARIDGLIEKAVPQGRIPLDEDTLLELVVRWLEAKGVDVDDKRKEALRGAVKQSYREQRTGRLRELVGAGASLRGAARAAGLSDLADALLTNEDVPSGTEAQLRRAG